MYFCTKRIQYMIDEHRLYQLEAKYKRMAEDFDILQESINHLPTIALVCFLSGLTAGCLICFLL